MSLKLIVRNTAIFLLLGILIALLFVVFQDSPVAITLLKFTIFPGTLFLGIAGLVTDWWDRKLFAKGQNRIGPRFWQPLYDSLKYMAKEDITPAGVDEPEFSWIPPIQLILAFMVAFFIPIYMTSGIISFEADLLFIFFLLAFIGGTIFLLGWATKNPWTLIGGSRAAVAELSLEIPFALSLVGPAILAGSLTIEEIVTSGYNLLELPINAISQTNGFELIDLLLILPLLLLFFIAIQSATAILEKVPFDPAHAETEIVGGWNVELTGKKLLFTKLANQVLFFAVAGLIAAVFLGGPNLNLVIGISLGKWDLGYYVGNIVIFIIKTAVIIFLITMMRTLNSRIRIDQLVQYFWRYYLPLTFLGLLVLIIFIGVI